MKRESLLKNIELTLQSHPICGLIGPRQAGKTTLARMFAEKYFPEDAFFFDLENPSDLLRLDNPLIAFGQVTQKLIILDEIQLKPDFFPILRVVVDDPQNKHIFLILGSASPELITKSSQSLAGRLGYVEVLPFSLEETKDSQRLWLRGGFPRSYLASSFEESVLWRINYIRTFLEQDIPSLGFKIAPQQLRRFWYMLAHYHGQVLNASDLGRSLGVSHHTIKNYVDILAGTFMIRILQPWYENISKRQIKSPKIYFRDSGILHTLLTIETPEALYNNPRVGASWEGFALEETIRSVPSFRVEPFFWSTQSDAEVDLFLIIQGKRLGFEFKYADAPKITKSMRIAINDLSLDMLYIVSPGNVSYMLDEKVSLCGLDLVPQELSLLKFSLG